MSGMAIKIRYDNGDLQQRQDLGIDALLNVEGMVEWLTRAPTPLQRAYAQWESRKRNGFVRTTDFELPQADGLSTYFMDVTPDDPAQYRFTAFNVLYVKELAGKVIAEHPIKQIQADLMCEYTLCKATKNASAHRITHIFGGFKRDYLRLLLPLCDRRGKATALACIARHLAAPAGSLQAIRPG
jgi:hypothetical protein